MSALLANLKTVADRALGAQRAARLPPLNSLVALSLRLSEGGVVPIIANDTLNAAWDELALWMDGNNPPKALGRETRRLVPRLLWRLHGNRPAISYPRIRQALVWSASVSNSLVPWVVELASAYTQAQGAPDECLTWIGTQLRYWCAQEDSAKLDVWRQRNRELELFTPAAFANLLQRKLWFSTSLPLDETLAQSGLERPSAWASDLSRLAFTGYVSSAVHSSSGYEAWHLQRIREWVPMLMPDAKIWSSDMAGLVINGLLEPWTAFNPPDVEFQKNIKSTLEGWFGPVSDNWKGHWSLASKISRDVLERWKVLDVMEEFFQRVDDYAKLFESRGGGETMRENWQYRRPFWLAYYKRGVVTRARALVGRRMIKEFGDASLKKAFGKAMARFEYTTVHHCGLLLEINGLLVVDLSHSGKCFFFLPSSNRRPSTAALGYGRDDLALADEEYSHHGSEGYAWQAKFAEFIARHTNVRLNLQDYRLS
ncbi:MAG TPA: hypothetical protein DDZ88_10135 [Verrucomicrobiales bacterium]|nr:hypothetical protein [Verrucomicrobiales bacterium]